MDSSGFAAKNVNLPPLEPMTMLGVVEYATDPSAQGTPVKIEINGSIDKGFFLADDDWTCYRRNYFSCVCSYHLTPHYTNVPLQFIPTGSQPVFPVVAFAMSISAVVADNDNQAIDLVQHTPKRDKGPLCRPDKVRLAPKPISTAHHPLGGPVYAPADSPLGSSRPYEQAYAPSSGMPFPTEHTFERIQFKQATANNGKRRAAQQYYHLIVELWADTGEQTKDPFIKVAYRKSAKMIVRGRSPGHYQSERRGSANNGPSGGAGGMGHYPPSGVMSPDFGPSGMLPGSYNGYESRPGSHYSTSTRQHYELPTEPSLSAEETKAITEPKMYQYYPATMYEGDHDIRHPVEMFSHQSRDQETHNVPPPLASGQDLATRAKTEYEPNQSLPSLFPPGNSFYPPSCGRFEGKAVSRGYYPAMLPPSSTLSMT